VTIIHTVDKKKIEIEVGGTMLEEEISHVAARTPSARSTSMSATWKSRAVLVASTAKNSAPVLVDDL
jgi:hypothetical protein